MALKPSCGAISLATQIAQKVGASCAECGTKFKSEISLAVYVDAKTLLRAFAPFNFLLSIQTANVLAILSGGLPGQFSQGRTLSSSEPDRFQVAAYRLGP